MSITSRINEMSSHIEQAYDELQGLGADLTNVNKNIENISMVLDDIYDSMPQVSGEGTSLTLEDTRVGKIKSTLKGNTSQTTYSGKNLISTNLSDLEQGTISGSDGTNSSANNRVRNNKFFFFDYDNIQPNYVWQIPSGYKNALRVYDKDKIFVGTIEHSGFINYLPQNYVGLGIKYVKLVYAKNDDSAITPNDIANLGFMLEKGSSASSYEPYVGGTTSPNPSYPQPVNVVSGDNEINVCGKNIWGSEEHGSINEQTGVDAYNENRWRTKGYIDVTPNTQYTLSSDANSNIYYIFYYYDNTKAFISSQPIIGKESATGTTPNNCYYMRCVIADTASIKTTQRQLEKNSTQTTYEPYQGNTYNIDLPEGMELCKIGNYQDYIYKDSGKWYLHKEIGKVVLNGSENSLSRGGTGTAGYYRWRVVLDNPLLATSTTTIVPLLCNRLTNVTVANTYGGREGFAIDVAGNYAFFYINETKTYSLDDMKVWLASNNLVVYYILATPVNTALEDM